MSFEMGSGGKSKTEEKGQSGFVVQVSGQTSAASQGMANKLNKQEHHVHHHRVGGGAPIEITSKLNGDTSGDGIVSFDNTPNSNGVASGANGQGVMTVATIKPTQKQISETTVLQMNNI